MFKDILFFSCPSPKSVSDSILFKSDTDSDSDTKIQNTVNQFFEWLKSNYSVLVKYTLNI